MKNGATVSVSGNNLFGFWGVFVTIGGEQFLVARCATETEAFDAAARAGKMTWA